MIEEGEQSSRQLEWDEMRQTQCDSELRRTYMLRQSMVQSLRDEAQIA